MAQKVTITKEELFALYPAETKEMQVKAWQNMSVKIKKLTIKQDDEVQAMLMNNASANDLKDGKLEVSVSLLQKSQWLAVSYALVEPRLTVDEISSLPTDAFAGVSEIYDALQEWGKPKKSRGESSSSN
ncbi:MAG: hypothetical protein PHE73_03605 [Sulfurovaceae bacterium]|nr:hypothetical protein [Sulfurovaceae bacterium]